MTGRSLALAALAVAVLGGGVGLVIAVRGTPDAVTAEPAAKLATPAPPAARRAEPAPATTEYKNFHAPPGRQAAVPAADAQRAPIPDGGFAAWSGREGMYPGDLEEFAKVAGVREPVALEQRRSTLLEERTSDPGVLAELLGAQPTGQMLATIGTQSKLMHEAAANAQVGNREGKLSDAEAIRQTREAEDTYRRTYQEATGLTDQQFDRFFSRDRPFR